MKQIFKYQLDENGLATTMIPKGAEFISAINQRGVITVYAVVDISNEREERRFVAIGTGWVIDDEIMEKLQFIGTVVCEPYVWHIYVEKIKG